MACELSEDWGLLAELQCRSITSMVKKLNVKSLQTSPTTTRLSPSTLESSPGFSHLPSTPPSPCYSLKPSTPPTPVEYQYQPSTPPYSPPSTPPGHSPRPSTPEIKNGRNELLAFSEKVRENPFSGADEEEEPDLSPAEKSLMKKILRTQLRLTTNEVEIQRQKKGSPLFSVKSFEQLQIRPELLRGLYAMGYLAPSKIQETSLPTLLANPPINMIAQSQNGTGKTAAFLVAALSRVNVEENYPQVLILSPTYELAIQTGEFAKRMAQFCNQLQFRYVVKGERLQRGHSLTEHFLVGTPGKVFDWARRHRFFDLSKIKVFILDEADVMISTQGHQDQCLRIHRLLSQDCQMLLFSATYTSEVMEFAEFIISDPIIIRLRKEEETLDNVKQYYIVCKTAQEKYAALCNVYGSVSVGQAIIFCRTKSTAAWLGGKLCQDGHSVAYLSSDLEVEQRIAVLTRFREGKEKVLITTNVCARGIDIEQVSIVVNFDLPVDLDRRADCETYLHRIGRSGRFGKCGIAINMVTDERDMQVLKDIEQHFDKRIEFVDADDVDDLEEMDK